MDDVQSLFQEIEQLYKVCYDYADACRDGQPPADWSWLSSIADVRNRGDVYFRTQNYSFQKEWADKVRRLEVKYGFWELRAPFDSTSSIRPLPWTPSPQGDTASSSQDDTSVAAPLQGGQATASLSQSSSSAAPTPPPSPGGHQVPSSPHLSTPPGLHPVATAQFQAQAVLQGQGVPVQQVPSQNLQGLPAQSQAQGVQLSQGVPIQQITTSKPTECSRAPSSPCTSRPAMEHWKLPCGYNQEQSYRSTNSSSFSSGFSNVDRTSSSSVQLQCYADEGQAWSFRSHERQAHQREPKGHLRPFIRSVFG